MAWKIDLPLTELLAGLAEEATELAQAALKLRRAYDKTNPTPLPEETCYDHLMEEIADVELYLDQIPYNPCIVREIKGKKEERWQLRIEHLKKNSENS